MEILLVADGTCGPKDQDKGAWMIIARMAARYSDGLTHDYLYPHVCFPVALPFFLAYSSYQLSLGFHAGCRIELAGSGGR